MPAPDLPNFILKLLLPSGKDVAIALPENEATLRIDPDDDPVFDLQSGTFHLQLNRVVFTGPGR